MVRLIAGHILFQQSIGSSRQWLLSAMSGYPRVAAFWSHLFRLRRTSVLQCNVRNVGNGPDDASGG